MKSILKIKFKATDYYTGNKSNFTKKITVEDENFVDTVIPEKPFGNITIPKHINSAKSKADDWLKDQNKLLQDLIYDEDLLHIKDWEILEITNYSDEKAEPILALAEIKPIKLTQDQKFEQFTDLIFERKEEETQSDKKFKTDLIATYVVMKDKIKDLKVEQQFSIVLAAMNVGVMAGSKIVNEFRAILDGTKTTDEIKKEKYNNLLDN